jgi:serine/threonine-protein kinase
MAPEQLRGEPVDRATDAYGAGATAFDLRYAYAPFEDFHAVLDEGIPPRFPAPATPAEAYFQHVLRELLAKRKDDRPRDLGKTAWHFATLFHALRPRGTGDGFAVLGKNRFRCFGCEIELCTGDIADEEVDGIVSSANYEMTMRTGVGDALRRRGGDAIEAEAVKDGERPLGECLATAAGSLRARHVLHAVSAWDETSCVGRAMQRALALADRLACRSLAFPALGTGAARVTIETCATAMTTALRWRLALGGSRLRRVRIVLGDDAKLHAFSEVAIEALRDAEAAPEVVDLGLPDERGAGLVAEDAATCLDLSSDVRALSR